MFYKAMTMSVGDAEKRHLGLHSKSCNQTTGRQDRPFRPPVVSRGGRARCVIIDEALLVGVDETFLVGGTVLIA